MSRGVLMCTSLRSSRGVMLRCVLSSASAHWRVTDQVQGPEDTVAEEQRPHEEERQEPLWSSEGANRQPATV